MDWVEQAVDSVVPSLLIQRSRRITQHASSATLLLETLHLPVSFELHNERPVALISDNIQVLTTYISMELYANSRRPALRLACRLAQAHCLAMYLVPTDLHRPRSLL